jgi:tetratricopeptide (TPR) repeat protein
MPQKLSRRVTAAICLAAAFVFTALISPHPVYSQEYGATAFQNSGSEEAQEPFLNGLLMLHSFEYEDAREAFQNAQRVDPDFAMAYWGEAMTHNHPVWFSQDRAAAVAALEKLGATADERLSHAATDREADYLEAAHILFGEGDKHARDDAFAEEMARIAAKYPDDLDAAAFHALSILGTSHEGRDFATYMRAAAVAEEVFAKNPRHPGAAHYLIHSYDDPVHAPLGLRAARAYSDIAPAAAHAQHMPSHIFVALGMWDDVVRTNESSWAASEQRVADKSLSENDRGFHALLWLTYGYLQQGRYADADALIQIMHESHQKASTGRTAYHLSAMRAAYVVETEDWDSGAAAAIEVEPSKLNTESGATEYFTRGLISIGREELDEATDALTALRALDGFNEEDNSAARARAMAYQLDGLLKAAPSGINDEALASLRRAAEIEEALPIDYGPPSPAKPSYELLADALLRDGNAEEAALAYRRALELAPRRAKSLEGLRRALELLGRSDKAAEISEVLTLVRQNADTTSQSRR